MPPVQPDGVEVGSVTDHNSDSESDSDIMAVAPEKFDGHDSQLPCTLLAMYRGVRDAMSHGVMVGMYPSCNVP